MNKDESAYRAEFLNRSLPFLTDKGAALLKGKTVGIAGCGGVGGCTAVTLARMGVGGFYLADPGLFDPPDINRQVGATTRTLGQNKSLVYAQILKDINPFVEVKTWTAGIQEDNVDSFVSGTDLIIDCLDLSVSPQLRGRMFKAARGRGIYAITAPVLGFGTIVVTSDPDGISMEPFVEILETSQGNASFPELLYRIFMPEHLDLIAQWLDEKMNRVPSIAVSPIMAAGVVSTEALNALIGAIIPGGRRPLALPQILMLDVYRMNFMVANAEVLFVKKSRNG